MFEKSFEGSRSIFYVRESTVLGLSLAFNIEPVFSRD